MAASFLVVRWKLQELAPMGRSYSYSSYSYSSYSFSSRSTAASMVASFFAKQSRAKRWPGGGDS